MAFARRTQAFFFRPESGSHFARARARFTQFAFFLPFSFEHFASACFSRCLLSHCAFFLPLRPWQGGFGALCGGLGGVGGGVEPAGADGALSFDDGLASLLPAGGSDEGWLGPGPGEES